MSDLVVQTRSLVKRYGKIAALDGLTLAVPRGAVYGFLGRNGAGKTTAIRILAGLACPAAGEARVLGLDPQHDRLAILARTGFVIEKALLPSMTGDDLVRFNRGFFPSWSDALAKKYAAALEIPMNQKFRKLSHGSKTKLCLLLALAQGAELLILDEPTTGLDPVVLDELLRVLVEDCTADGRTIFLSSHQLAEIEQIADHIGIMDRGKILVEGPLDDIRSSFRRLTVTGASLPTGGDFILTARCDAHATQYVTRRDPETFALGLTRNGATIVDSTPLSLNEIFLALCRTPDKETGEGQDGNASSEVSL
jgi:ABC-2 type transport system ATP-binding protein